MGSALQLQPHRRAPDRPEADVGAHGWRRSGAASLERSRQRLRRRRGRLHRRHAGDSRPRWAEPGRLRVPGDRDALGSVEARAAASRAIASASTASPARPPSTRRLAQDEFITGLEPPHGMLAGAGDAAVDDVEPVPGTGRAAADGAHSVVGAAFGRQRQRCDLRAPVRRRLSARSSSGRRCSISSCASACMR